MWEDCTCEVWPTLYTDLQYFNFMSKVKAMSDKDPSTTVSTLGSGSVRRWAAQPAVDVTTELVPGHSYVLRIGGAVYLDLERKDTVKLDLQLQYKVPSTWERMKRKLR